MNTFRTDPDSEATQEASRQNEREVFALKMQSKRTKRSGFIYVGFVTEESIKAGCPKPINSPVSNKTPMGKRAALALAKQQKLRDITIHPA